MTILHILFPILAVGPTLINGVAMRIEPRHGDAFGVSFMILAIWIGQMIMSPISTVTERAGLNAAMDTVGCLTVLLCWTVHRAPWALAVVGLYLLQVYLACAFLWGWEVFDRAIKYGDYVRSNNVVWLLALVAVSVGGGRSVVGRICDGLRRAAERGGPVGRQT